MSGRRWGVALALLVVVVLLLIVAAIPFGVTLSFGFAWGLLASMAVGAGLCWLAGHLGMDGGADVLFIGGGAVVVGLIGGLIWRLLS